MPALSIVAAVRCRRDRDAFPGGTGMDRQGGREAGGKETEVYGLGAARAPLPREASAEHLEKGLHAHLQLFRIGG